MTIEAILLLALGALFRLLEWTKTGKPLSSRAKVLYGRVMFRCIRVVEYGQMIQIEPSDAPVSDGGPCP